MCSRISVFTAGQLFMAPPKGAFTVAKFQPRTPPEMFIPLTNAGRSRDRFDSEPLGTEGTLREYC